MSQKVWVLAHNQPASARARTNVPREVALSLLQRMVAERITAKLIRMFPPDSETFPTLKAELQEKRYIPDKLPPREVPNTYFEEPKSPSWRLAHRMVNVPKMAKPDGY